MSCAAGCVLPAVPTSAHAEDVSASVVPLAPEQGGPRRWSVAAPDGLAVFSAPSEASGVMQTLSEGVILTNLGCAQDDDRVWCTVRPLAGGARGFVTPEFLMPARGPDGTVPMGVDDSRHRARKRQYDVRGDAACAQERGQAMGKCTIGVARGTGGDASVVVTFPNGFARTLYFIHGAFMSASATMSGVGRDTDWEVRGSTHFVRVDDQRYELSNTLVFGD